MNIILRIIIQFLLIPYIKLTDLFCFVISESVINLWLLHNTMILLFNFVNTGRSSVFKFNHSYEWFFIIIIVSIIIRKKKVFAKSCWPNFTHIFCFFFFIFLAHTTSKSTRAMTCFSCVPLNLSAKNINTY